MKKKVRNIQYEKALIQKKILEKTPLESINAELAAIVPLILEAYFGRKVLIFGSMLRAEIMTGHF